MALKERSAKGFECVKPCEKGKLAMFYAWTGKLHNLNQDGTFSNQDVDNSLLIQIALRNANQCACMP